MLYCKYRPDPTLRDFVEDFWLVDGYAPPHLKERIVPSGTIELVINLRENELRIYDAKQPAFFKRFSGALMSGAYSGFFVSDTAEEASIMGVHFKPGGAVPFLSVPPSELADSHVDLEMLWGRSSQELRERLCLAVSPNERFRLLQQALTSHVSLKRKRHYAVPMTLEAFARANTHATVSEIARRSGLSQRRFIRVFEAEVRITPKLFSRIRRFDRLLTLVQQNQAAASTSLSSASPSTQLSSAEYIISASSTYPSWPSPCKRATDFTDLRWTLRGLSNRTLWRAACCHWVF